MTDFEERLAEIVTAIELNAKEGNTNTFAVEQIIQAFKDDGWSKSITIPYVKFKSSKELNEKLKKAWEKSDD
jgi:sporulation protein YlmC with PRC-barrel domain